MKRVISILAALVMIFVLLPVSAMPLSAETSAVWDGSVATSFARGAGTELDPYIIETAPQLAFLASSVNAGTTYSGKYIKLANDIVLNNTANWENWDTTAPANSWTPIGNSETNSFKGIFDGDNHTVSGIYIKSTGSTQGLFSLIDTGEIYNLGVIKSYTDGDRHVGSLAGISRGTVRNCYNTGTVSGNYYTGGLVGAFSGIISDCYNTGKVSGGTSVGGITGSSAGIASNCYNTGEINGDSTVGGIMGYNDSNIVNNCYNAGVVNGNSYVGGLVGDNRSAVSNSYNAGTVNGNSNAGGVAGGSTGIVNCCYNTGAVSGNSGVVGYVDTNIINSIKNCYYLFGTAVGGINGEDITGKAEVLTDAQMKVQSNFVGWDFAYEWFLDAQYRYDSSSEYPQLQSLGNFSTVPSSAVWDGSTDIDWAGSGTESNPYLITSASELAGLAEKVNSGTTYSTKYFTLTTNINLNNFQAFLYWQHGAKPWIPIGKKDHYFGGTFKGEGHTVSGIYINTANDYQGLFGYMYGSVDNLGVIDSYIKGDDYIGGIVGYNDNSKISNCYNTAIINGYSNVGGVAGRDYFGTVSNCHNTGTINGYSYVGGVTGRTYGAVNNCYNTGAINGSSYIGGVTGNIDDYGIVSNCYNTGTIQGRDNVGGIAGSSYNIVTNCYNSGIVSGNYDVGGIVGENNFGIIKYCYSSGAVSGTSYVGGVAGNSGFAVSNCYYLSGTVTGGINGADITGKAEPLTSAQMKSKPNFIGWDFKYDWFLDAQYRYDNSSEYPQLQIFGDFSSVPSSEVWNGSSDTDWAGNGTESSPYLITSAAELAGLAEKVNSGTSYAGKYFELTTDIILNDFEAFPYWQHGARQWTPIGKPGYIFAGTFNGDEHTISGIYINTISNQQGLFNNVSGRIDGLGVIESYIKGDSDIGGIAGYVNSGTLNNCYNTGTVIGNDTVGGIAADVYSGTISNCYNTGVIGQNLYAGGVVGLLSSGTVINCYNTGEVNGSVIGGVAGRVSGTVRDCYNNASVGGKSYTGGVAGYISSSGTVRRCSNSGEVSGIWRIGGIAGYVLSGAVRNSRNSGAVKGYGSIGGVAGYIESSGTVSSSCNTGAIKGEGTVGGVAGYLSEGIVTDCYNTGTVEGDSIIGGVAGSIFPGTVTNCYNAGTVTGESTGGVLGDAINPCTISNNYYLAGTAPGGIYGADADGKAEPRTVAQMKSQPNFVNWDFETVWEFGGVAIGYYYPTLIEAGPNVATYTLTIHYQYEDGNIAAQTVTQSLHQGDSYSVSSPVIEGYQSGNLTVSGVMGDANITITVQYYAKIEGVWDGSIATGFASGTGTGTDPYIIETAPQLAFLASSVNAGTSYIEKYIQLANDIVLNYTGNWENWNTIAPANSWISIGNSSKRFKGMFNGGGHTVSGIYINTTDDYQGLFGYLGGSDYIVIENIGVIRSYIKGDDYIGGVGGYFEHVTLSNCYNTGKVCGDLMIGGVAGYPMGSTVINCYNMGTVSGNQNIGGLAGDFNGSVSNCYNTGAISGTSYVGGLAGQSYYNSIKDCYNTGTLSGSSYMGGLVGKINSTILSNSYNTGIISSGSSFIGGVAGQVSTGIVENCYYLLGTAAGGINGANISGQAEALTDAEMKQKSSFIGWDFSYGWFLDSQYRYNTSLEYPQLQTFGDFSSIPSSAVWDGLTDTDWTGSGTENDPYLITSVNELAGLAETVNNGSTYLGEYFELSTDIIINDDQPYWQHKAIQWTPIGKDYTVYFGGIFNGNGHTVNGIYINNQKNNQGLFGYISGELYNLGTIGSYIKGNNNISGIAGTIGSSGFIKNCYNTGTVNGYSSVGGVGGGSYGTINNCYNAGVVSGTVTCGGIIGFALSGTVNDCYNVGEINGITQVGGIVSLLGTSCIINNCYNMGEVNGYSTLGGVAGDVYNMMRNCYNTGKVNGFSSVGGVVGREKSTGSVSNCYSTGVISGNTSVGGVVGSNESGSIGHCYYLTGSASGGINGADVVGQAQVLTDAQMRSQSSFVGWDFETIWIFGGSDYNYPIFRIPVTGVNLSDDSMTLNINATKQLAVTFEPVTASNRNVIWSSSDSTVASVSASGLVTALKTGKAVITATTEDGGFTDTCSIIAVNAADEANYSYTIINEIVTVTRYKGTATSATVPTYLGGCPVTAIGSGCFANCTTLVRAYIPVSIVTIAADAFSGCSNLKFIYFSGNAPAIVSSGNRSGNRLSESPFGAGVTVYFRTGTAGWDNPAWIDKATGIVPGDINGDGRLNMNDAVSFVQRLTQGSSATYTQIEFVAADVVRDGAINMSDIVKMVQALANSSIVLY